MKTSAIARAIALTALGVVIVWGMYLARDVVLIVYVSTLFAIGLGPLVAWVERTFQPRGRRLPHWAAILAIYLTFLAGLIVVALLVVPPLIDQMQELWTRLPGLVDRAQAFLIERRLLNHRITVEEVLQRAPGPGDAVGTVAIAITSVFGIVVAFVTVLMLTFYMLVESDSLFAGFARLFPSPERPRVREVAAKISTKLSAWLNGQMILSGAIGLSAAVGLYLLGVPYFYVLALLAAIGEAIPVVGPVLSAIPAIGVAFTVSPRTALFTAAFMMAQQQIENHFLVPKVMERQVGVSAVTVIVALLFGGSLLGILGAILAVPSAAVIQVVVQELLDERDRRAAADPLGPSFD